MKVYKVVGGDYRSIIVTGKYSLKFRIGRKTKAKIGEIFCFGDLESAEQFIIRRVFSGLILECETDNAHSPGFNMIPTLYKINDLNNKNSIECFWKKEGRRIYHWYVSVGTVMCKSIKPIKEINREQKSKLL